MRNYGIINDVSVDDACDFGLHFHFFVIFLVGLPLFLKDFSELVATIERKREINRISSNK